MPATKSEKTPQTQPKTAALELQAELETLEIPTAQARDIIATGRGFLSMNFFRDEWDKDPSKVAVSKMSRCRRLIRAIAREYLNHYSPDHPALKNLPDTGTR